MDTGQLFIRKPGTGSDTADKHHHQQQNAKSMYLFHNLYLKSETFLGKHPIFNVYKVPAAEDVLGNPAS